MVEKPYSEILRDGTPYRDGTAIVLLHPLGGTLEFWRDSLSLWQTPYSIIAYDRAGAGKSPVPSKPLTPHECVEELEQIRLKFGLAKIIPIGVAIGAMIGAKYAATYPEHVAALILCNPAGKLSEAGRKLARERLVTLREKGIEALADSVVDRAFSGIPHDATYQKYLTSFRQHDPSGYEANALTALEFDITGDLKHIEAPTLVLAGESDSLFLPDDIARIAQSIKGAQHRVIPNSAHFPPIQNPSAFAQIVDSFLKTLPL